MKSKAFDQSKYENWIDPHEVIPYERNAKKHDDKQIKNIANSIERFGWQQDTVLTTDKVCVIGHGRRLAAIEIGCMMPYHLIDKTADELTDEDIRELRIADNQTNAEKGLDLDLLGVEIADLDFDGFEFDFGLKEEKEPKEKPEVEFSEILGEENNYLVLQFKTDVDWLQALSVFNIPTVKSYSTRRDGKLTKSMTRMGTARVLDGAKVLHDLGVV